MVDVVWFPSRTRVTRNRLIYNCWSTESFVHKSCVITMEFILLPISSIHFFFADILVANFLFQAEWIMAFFLLESQNTLFLGSILKQIITIAMSNVGCVSFDAWNSIHNNCRSHLVDDWIQFKQFTWYRCKYRVRYGNKILLNQLWPQRHFCHV